MIIKHRLSGQEQQVEMAAEEAGTGAPGSDDGGDDLSEYDSGAAHCKSRDASDMAGEGDTRAASSMPFDTSGPADNPQQLVADEGSNGGGTGAAPGGAAQQQLLTGNEDELLRKMVVLPAL